MDCDKQILSYPIGSKYFSNQYINKLTKFLDLHTFKRINPKGGMCSYIMHLRSEEDKQYFAIRYPGATRGFLITDLDYIIQDIQFNDELADIYKPESLKEIKKFIGHKLLFRDYECSYKDI